MAKQLLLVGDSNVRRYFDRLSGLVGAEVDFVQSRNVQEWSEVIPMCRSGYKIVTYSCRQRRDQRRRSFGPYQPLLEGHLHGHEVSVLLVFIGF